MNMLLTQLGGEVVSEEGAGLIRNREQSGIDFRDDDPRTNSSKSLGARDRHSCSLTRPYCRKPSRPHTPRSTRYNVTVL